MNVNERCELCGFTHHFYNTAGGCRAFGVKTFAERKIEELEARVSVWVDIKFAPKDGKPVDLWGYDRDPDPKKGGILLPLALSLGRWTDCVWAPPMAMSAGGLMMPMEQAWYQRTELQLEPGGINRLRRIWPSHYMEIPAPPESSRGAGAV